MADSTKARKWLEKRLGDFLGFQDDSLSEVLDHLQSIENEGDLLDYLEQLLGSRDEDVRVFVKDVGRYRQGLPLLVGISEQVTGEDNHNSNSKPPAVIHPTVKKATTSTNKKTLAKPAAAATATSTAPKDTTTKSPPVKPSTAPLKAESTNSYNSEPSKPIAAPSESNEESKPPPTKKYGLPPKGKAKRTCGCFGTVHKPLTNCLYCGRISCADEGYDFCSFCGYLVEEVQPPEGESNSEATKAWQHKERLLRYDRDSAQRTLVLDDQADYYSNQTSSWLTDDEQVDAEFQDAEERSNLHERKKQTLNIAF